MDKTGEGAGNCSIKEGYDFIKSLSQQEKVCTGLKRGLLGDLTEEYVWFLVPVCSRNPEMPGNTVAVEASSGEAGVKATYFFRIVSGKEEKEKQSCTNKFCHF